MPANSKLLIACLLLAVTSHAEQFKVISSADPDSNAEQSFVVVPDGVLLPHGIKHNTTETSLGPQLPFIVEFFPDPGGNTLLQWQITVPSRNYGGIKLLSLFPGNFSYEKNTLIWRSQPLSSDIPLRNKLIFKPDMVGHKPVIYRRGVTASGERHPHGGGTLC